MLSSFENWRPGKSRDFVPFQPGPMLKVMEARTGWLLLFFFDVAVVVFMGVGGGLGSVQTTMGTPPPQQSPMAGALQSGIGAFSLGKLFGF